MDEYLVLQVALREEARQVLRTGDWQRKSSPISPEIYEGRIGGGEAVLAISGVGRGHAEATAKEVLRKYHVNAFLSVGFAGGLFPGQLIGDLVVAHTTMAMPFTSSRGMSAGQQSLRNGCLESDRQLTHDALLILEMMGLRHRSGLCITASSVMSSPGAKRQMGDATGALAVDMESLWIGLECRQREVPFLAVHSIVDVVEQSVPPFAERFASDASYSTQRLLPLLLQPRSLSSLFRLAHAASVSRSSLTAFIVQFLNSRSRNGDRINWYACRRTL